MKAVILSGGKGKRFRPYTYILPKPLLPIKGRAILDINLEKLKKQGINDIILAVGYMADTFQTIFGGGSSRDMNISYIRENKPLGTAGPLGNLERKIKEDFLVMNGDIISNVDFRDILKFHKDNEAKITVVTRKIKTPIDFGVIIAKDNTITSWKEKPVIYSEISAGMYILNPSVLRYIPKGEFFDMPDLVKKIMESGEKVCKFLYRGKILDIGHLKDYMNAIKNLDKI